MINETLEKLENDTVDFKEITGHTDINEPTGNNNGENGENGPNGPKNTQEQTNANGPETVNADFMNNLPLGEIFIEAADVAIPGIISIMAARFKGLKIDSKQLKATAAEKSVMIPAADNYLKSVNFKVSPLGALVGVMVMVYGMKTAQILNDAPEIIKKQDAAKATRFSAENQPKNRGRKPKDKNDQKLTK